MLLNFSEAEALAKASGWLHEFQSDGQTLLRVGRWRALRALAYVAKAEKAGDQKGGAGSLPRR